MTCSHGQKVPILACSMPSLVKMSLDGCLIIWGPPEPAWSTDGALLLTGAESGTVQVWDVASPWPAKRVHLLFDCDTEHRVTMCSFDGYRCVLTNHGVFPIPPQHRPLCAADDLHPTGTLLRLRDDGRIWLVGQGISERPVCWIPPAYRPVVPAFNRNIIVGQSNAGDGFGSLCIP